MILKLENSLMEPLKFKTLMQSLEDFVFIEEKVVTSLWLCQTLKIHANTAKQVLHAFLQEDGVREKVSITYLLSGELKNGPGLQLKLVDSSNLEEAKDSFSKIDSIHVHSIQKSATPQKSTDIFNVFPHFNIDSENRSLCSIKPAQNIEKRIVKNICSEPKKEAAKPSLKESKPVEKSKADGDSKSSSVTQLTSSKQKGLDNDFKKSEAAEKRKSLNDGTSSTENQPPPAKQNKPSPVTNKNKVEKSKSGGLSAFFQKQTAKNAKAAEKLERSEKMEVDEAPAPIKETNMEAEKKTVVKEKDKEERSSSKDGKAEATKPISKGKKTSGKENRNKRKKREEKEEESRKKRKRIAAVFSSESESSENEMSDREEPEPELERAGEEPPSLEKEMEEEDIIPPTPGRKRIRKQISKTFTDEDGFILTKKEYVYESCTDDEGSEEIKDKPLESTNGKEEEATDSPKETTNKESKKTTTDTKKLQETKKKTSPNSSNKKKSQTNDKTGNKQASIMSFFKKK